MKKILFLFSLFVLALPSVMAKSRTQSEAYQIANSNKIKSLNGAKKASATNEQLVIAYSKSSKNKDGKLIASYYVFNKSNNAGFVIVSGDDRAKQILGYSDEGSFDQNNLPENFKYWLSLYENEIMQLPSMEVSIPNATQQIVNSQPLKTPDVFNFEPSISPLLGQIKWDQDAPYNDLCPLIPPENTSRSVTGCVATGMAQVMKYHEWPVTGTGSKTYTTSTHEINLSVNFANTTFDWANMADTYSDSSTTAQKSAVATLMYNCGVAVEMDYAESSGAYTTDMAKALRDNFGYDPNLQQYYRNYYSRTEWEDKIKSELNAFRPVLYAGQSSEGGHLFVCDGYDSNNLYHINWGWSGTSNGYFELSALNPSTHGVGGGVGGFNSGQDIVVGVQKPTSSLPSYLLFMSDTLQTNVKTLALSGNVTITATDMYNRGVNNYGAKFTVGLYDNSGIFIQTVASTTSTTINSNYGYSSIDKIVTLPTLANGTYRLYYIYKESSATAWTIVRAPVGTSNYVQVTVNNNLATFDSTPTAVYPNLQLTNLSVVGNIYQNQNAEYHLSITNSGAEYNSAMILYLESKTDEDVYEILTTDQINIINGETKDFTITAKTTLAPGEYYLSVVYDPLNNYDVMSTGDVLGTSILKSILATPTQAPALSLTTAISFPDASHVYKSTAQLTAVVQNTGGLFDNKMIAFIFPSTGGQSLTYSGYQDVLIDNGLTKTVKFNNPIDLSAGNYKIGVYYYNNGWNRLGSTLNFTLLDDITSVNKSSISNELLIFPNPASDFISFSTSENIQEILIVDMFGKNVLCMGSSKQNQFTIQINHLSSGTYIIKVKTDSGVKVNKFIKQ